MDCSACREHVLDKIANLERKTADEISTLKSDVAALNIYVGKESDGTGLYGAINRAFVDVQELKGVIKGQNNLIQELTISIKSREDQAKGAMMTAKMIYFIATIVGASGILNIIASFIK